MGKRTVKKVVKKQAPIMRPSLVAPQLRGLIQARGYPSYRKAWEAIQARTEARLGLSYFQLVLRGKRRPSWPYLDRVLDGLGASYEDLQAARPKPDIPIHFAGRPRAPANPPPGG